VAFWRKNLDTFGLLTLYLVVHIGKAVSKILRPVSKMVSKNLSKGFQIIPSRSNNFHVIPNYLLGLTSNWNSLTDLKLMCYIV
jgi:hypothetical protein